MTDLCKYYRLFRVINLGAREVRLVLERNMSTIRKEYVLDGVEEFFDLLDLCQYVCVEDYSKAWNHDKATPRLRARLLNAIFISCRIHGRKIVKELYRLHPSDKVLNYFMGLIFFGERKFSRALEHFLDAKDCESLEEPTYLHHLLLSAMFTNNRDLARDCASRLARYVDYVEVCMVLINYFVYLGEKSKARRLLRKIKKYLDEDLIRDINEMIRTGRYNRFYVYYPSLGYIQPHTCPIGSLIRAIIGEYIDIGGFL